MTREPARAGVSPVRIKSYFCHSVEDAMSTARHELGPDAMLVSSRRTPAETHHLGEYDVVFATSAAGPLPAAADGSHAAGERLAAEVGELKRQLEGMRRALTKSAFAPSQWLGASPDLAEAYALLTANDVAPELAREMVQAAGARLTGPTVHLAVGSAPADRVGWQAMLVQEIESRFTVEATLGSGAAPPHIAALVGPPGAGKTTTLVKLAVNYGLACRRPVLLLSMDTYRIAAADQLRSYAGILGVGFQVLETVSALAQSLEENQGKELILIDTPGFGFADFDGSSELAQFLAGRSDIDIHLVLSSSFKPVDLTRVIDAYEIFRPGRLLFTKLDETMAAGAIFNETVRTGKPLSFFATGQRIPEDLEAATRGRLTDLILGGRARAQSAA